MNLEEKVMSSLKTAMLNKDDVALRSLRAIKSAILLAKTDGSGKEVTEADEVKILQKLVKQRKDSLAIYKEQNRPDLAKKEEDEIGIIETFLPAQMSESELIEVIKEIIQSVGANSPADMGKVMGAATKALAGKSDGGAISAVVKLLLNQPK